MEAQTGLKLVVDEELLICDLMSATVGKMESTY